MGGNVAARFADPGGGVRGAGQAHGFGECLVDVAGRQPLQRAPVPRVRALRRAVGAMHLWSVTTWLLVINAAVYVLDHVLTNGQESATKWCAPATLWEEEGRWCVEVDLPGVGIDDIDVTLDNSTLRLIAERQRPHAERKFFHQERAYGRIERIIRLPESVNPDAIEAELKDGVLRLSLAKRAELQPKKIQVKAN